MIEIEGNESLKNVAENSLTKVKLLPNTVFFGINGAGKSTVCEVLSRHAKLKYCKEEKRDVPQVYSFDTRWQSENVGEFVEGGSAKGVTTVILESGGANLEEEIRKAEIKRESTERNWTIKVDNREKFEKDRNDIVEQVFKGTRQKLASSCQSLSGNRFNRKAIENILTVGKYKQLPSAEIQIKIDLANTEDGGTLPSLPSLPDPWTISDDLWQQVIKVPTIDRSAIATINEWVRQGLKLHSPGSSCQFCNGTVTPQRIEELEAAIRHAETEAPELVKENLQGCTDAISAMQAFVSRLEVIEFSTSPYVSDLPAQKNEAILKAQKYLREMKAAEQLLKRRVDDPFAHFIDPRPEVNPAPLQEAFETLRRAHASAQCEIRNHSKNKEDAVQALKKHCCAADGSSWKSINEKLEEARKEEEAALEAKKVAEEELSELKESVSSTQQTAKFLNKSLRIILGDKTLQVSVGGVGEGYRITRHGQPAKGMSEGEKKLVSLLYFCAEFFSEERKALLKNSVIAFDDLGAELDEARLLAIDRFITDHFRNALKIQPASIVYFTHSHTYLRILQNRLADKVSSREGAEPTAIFYEIYKDIFHKSEQTTRCRKWDDQAVRLTNEYWLSFYMLLKAFERLQDDNEQGPDGGQLDLGTGNYCRKVLEGFTEFRSPNSVNFGTRLDNLIRKANVPISPSLSKLVNGLSHTSLHKDGGVLARHEVERALIETLNLVRVLDPDHFDALTNKLIGKNDARQFRDALSRLIDEEGTVRGGA